MSVTMYGSSFKYFVLLPGCIFKIMSLWFLKMHQEKYLLFLY